MDYTKDHKNRVNSLLMEKWGYGKNKMEEGPEDEPFEGYDTPHVYDVVDAGGDYGDAYPGQSVARPESTPKLKAKAKKSISRSSNDNPHNRGDERDREGTNLYPEGQELEEAATRTPKNVETFLKKLNTLKSIIATIDDPKEVLEAIIGLVKKISEENPTDLIAAEKYKVFVKLRQYFTDQAKNVGKEKKEIDSTDGPPTAEDLEQALGDTK